MDLVLALKALSHPLRLRALLTLSERGECTFTELLRACGLSVERDCGLLDYHLKRLVAAGLVERGGGGGYRLTGEGSRAAELVRRGLLEDLERGADVDCDRLVVRELTEDDVELVASAVSRAAEGRVPPEILEAALERVRELVSGAQVEARGRAVRELAERLGASVSGRLDARSLSLVALYDGELAALVCGVVYSVGLTAIRGGGPHEIAPRSAPARLYEVTRFWLSPSLNRAKLLDAVLAKIEELAEERGISCIVWRIPEAHAEVADYLERKGYYAVRATHLVAVTGPGSSSVAKGTGLGVPLPPALVEVWRFTVRGELTWALVEYHALGSLVVRALELGASRRGG